MKDEAVSRSSPGPNETGWFPLLNATYSLQKVEPENEDADSQFFKRDCSYDDLMGPLLNKDFERKESCDCGPFEIESLENVLEQISVGERLQVDSLEIITDIEAGPLKKVFLPFMMPRAISFMKRELQCGFEGRFQIRNLTEDILTYRVSSSGGDKFHFHPEDIGWLPPQGLKEITIRTNRIKVTEFSDISSEGLLVQCTPLYNKTQCDMSTLDLLWKGLGTEMFPIECTEEYTINQIVPHKATFLDNLSMMEQMLLGPAFKANLNPEDCDPLPSTCERVFYENWPGDTEEALAAQSERLEGAETKLVEAFEEVRTGYKISAVILIGGILMGLAWFNKLFGQTPAGAFHAYWNKVQELLNSN